MPINPRNEKREIQERIVGWGKHAGKRMNEVPTDYLEWFVENSFKQMKSRKRWANDELERRRNLNNL